MSTLWVVLCEIDFAMQYMHQPFDSYIEIPLNLILCCLVFHFLQGMATNLLISIKMLKLTSYEKSQIY